ncbi:BAH_G0050010.mRNA.1.CDS.1 [Saccharomyces cerevisiae]|nr:SX2_G0034110.mRNA.1.CDS.1 [Saccharomyces cerevisiae]CAI4759053.1 BAH_G0050010.mRNA.1.CDS.1 [Saccharomyces cerevisiae]CAI4761609.1 BAG_1a_G0050000.mRNA.1.CDS.1 [Saccharomyces cerevisiae]CAI7323402.1 BAG_1a_G0050000.mRNA.1.CDS.1 [Saccharomyces cerevisiae]CAI7325376.1 BAH_G0050010.mRNA.1.CDS.1 [Saccharomyces cerevisiae]
MQHRRETRSPLPAKQKTQKKSAPKEMGPQYVRMYGPKIKAIIRTGNPDDGINLPDAGRGTLTAATIWSRAYHSNYAYHVRPKVVTLSEASRINDYFSFIRFICMYIYKCLNKIDKDIKEPLKLLN